jgi:hypothetical protein
MSLFSKFTTVLALATTAALGSAGCVAEGEDPTEESAEESAEEALSPEEEATDTDTASEALTSSDWGRGCRPGDYCLRGGLYHYNRGHNFDRYDWWSDSWGRYWNDRCENRHSGYSCNSRDYERYYRHRDHHGRGRGRGHGRGHDFDRDHW